MPSLPQAGNSLHGAVVVITGASSGIGRVTAHEFAKDGARLVLAARSAGTLEDVVAECTALGAEAVAVPTDIGRESEVTALMEAAVQAFGRIDVCVANASVFSYGTFEATPPEVFRQVIETTLFGTINTVRAALPHFRAQGRGTLIVIGSVYSKVTSPYVSPYVTAKFGLRGFTEVLRQELREAKDIHVCLVLPSTIDTPIYQHAANYTGRPVHPIPPIVSPERVAKAILRNARRPRRATVVGQVQRTLIPFHSTFPKLYDRCINLVLDNVALRRGSAAPATGTVFTPDPPSNQITGNWRAGSDKNSAGRGVGDILGSIRRLLPGRAS